MKEPVVCTVKIDNDMGHYSPIFNWHGSLRKDLENYIWTNIKNNHIEVIYDTITGCRFFKFKIKNKKLTVNGVNVYIILK